MKLTFNELFAGPSTFHRYNIGEYVTNGRIVLKRSLLSPNIRETLKKKKWPELDNQAMIDSFKAKFPYNIDDVCTWDIRFWLCLSGENMVTMGDSTGNECKIKRAHLNFIQSLDIEYYTKITRNYVTVRDKNGELICGIMSSAY
jgi:hypothetical protein